MLVTIINMYRAHDAECFTWCVRGTLTDEQKEEWRKAHKCDDHDPAPEDGDCPNNLFFRTIHLGENSGTCDLMNVDGENELPKAAEDKAKLVKLRSVKVDCEGFDAADSPDAHGTTYYGGEIHISDDGGVDIQIECKGNDRGDDECYYPTMEAVAGALGLVDVEHWNDELTDEFQQHIGPGSEFQVGIDGDKLIFLPVDGELTSQPIPTQEG